MQLSKSLVLCTALAVLALPLAGDASAQNILVNGDFETGDLIGWVVAGGNASAGVTVESGNNGPAAPGNNNAFMENFGEAVGLTMKQTTPVGSISGGTVFYSYDLKLDQADIGGVLFVEIFAEQEGVGIVGGSGLKGPYWAWEWTTVMGEFEAPENADFITIQFMANTGAAVGSNCVAHVDNVDINQGSVPNEAANWGEIKALYR